MLSLVKKTLLLLLLLLTGASALIYLNLNTIAENIIKNNLQKKGIHQLDFKIKSISLNNLIVENLTWDRYCLKIKNIDYNFSLGQLLNHQYGKIAAEDISSCYTHETNQSSQPATVTLPLLYPFLKNVNFEKIEIKNLKNTLYLGNTQLNIGLNLEYFSLQNSKGINLQVELTQDLTTAHFTLKSFLSDQAEEIHFPYIEISDPNKIKIVANNLNYFATKSANESIVTQVNAEQLSFNHFTIKNVSIKNKIVNLPNNRHQGKFAINQLEDGQSGIRNFKMDGTYKLDQQQISVNANIFPINKLFNLKLSGQYELDKKNGELTLFIPKFKVDDKKSIDVFFPLSPLHKLESLVFNLDLNGTIKIKNNIIKPLLTLNLTDLSVVHDQKYFKNINSIFILSNLSPLMIRGEITALSLDWPVPIRNFKTRFSFHQNQVTLNTLVFNLWEGEFIFAPVVYNTIQNTITPTELNFSSLSLTQLFAFLDKPNLKGTGKIGGKLPLTFKLLIPMITDGHLYSEESGNLQLQLQPETKQAMGNNQHINILTDFMDNLNYRKINLDLSTNDKLDIKSQIKIFGTNPDLQNKYQGRPLAFKMTLNFNIVKMLKSQGASLELPEKIEKLFLKVGN